MRRATSIPSLTAWLAGLLVLGWTVQLSRADPAQSPPSADRKPEQVIVVFKTHFDIGYTDLARNVVERDRTSMIDKALDLEAFVRGMRFSSDLSRRCGMPLARDAKMTDVPSHTWIVPTVLKHAG